MNSKITSGHLDIVELPFLDTKRVVRIWTPDDYNKDKKYPVIYMHDGQNIFNYFDKSMEMWNLNEIVTDSIIVGVDHGGIKRIDELSPKAWTKYGKNAPYVRFPCGEKYCDFLVNKVMSYVNENYSSPITVKEIAREFNISVSYHSHEFSRYTSRSVYEYILYRRVMLAKQMIYTGQSFSSICAQCGFPDYSNFLRMFKKYTGLSPSQYRDYLTSKGVGGSGENG